MNQINCEAFNELDDEIKQEFFEDVQAAIKDVNDCAAILEEGADAQVIDRMFRSLHTVKGNCNMVFLDDFVQASHRLEDLFSEIRSGEVEYNDTFGQFAVAVIGEIDKQLCELMKTGSADADTLKKLDQLISSIEQTSQDARLALAEKAIIAIQDGHFNPALVALDHEHGRAFSFLDATDVEFFEFISDQQVNVEPRHHDFLEICEPLALKLNALLGRKIDEQQLKAVIIFVGLSFNQSLQAYQWPLKVEQLFFASGLLSRMSGWDLASEIIMQLLEKHDGSGEPQALHDEQIKPAAQALALSIEFACVVMEHQSAGYKQSLFTAVKTINSQKDSRYKSRLIERFNSVIKSEYLTAQHW